MHGSRIKEVPEIGKDLNSVFTKINRLKILKGIKGVVTSG